MRMVENPIFFDVPGFFLKFWKDTRRNLPTFVPECVATLFSVHLHTLCGLHYQAHPYEQTELAFCSHDWVHDVVADAPGFIRWNGPCNGITWPADDPVISIRNRDFNS